MFIEYDFTNRWFLQHDIIFAAICFGMAGMVALALYA